MNSNNFHRMTPPTKESPLNALGSDTTAIREQLVLIQETLASLEPLFKTLEVKSTEVFNLTPTMNATIDSVKTLRDQTLLQEAKMDHKIERLKNGLKGKLRDQIVDHMRLQIHKNIKAELNHQVSGEVELKIKDHLPVPLETQVAESQKEVAEIRLSLCNSEARRINSLLRLSPSGCAKAIRPIFNSNGNSSELFPPNLKTLFSYDLEKSKTLLRDYSLVESENRIENFNEFMSFIGIQDRLETFTS